MEEGEEETSPNIGDIVEITDDDAIYTTLNECELIQHIGKEFL